MESEGSEGQFFRTISLPEIHELDGHGKFMGAHGGVRRAATRAHG
jgi:hypothetical protein